MAGEGEVLTLHAVLKGEVEKKHRWLQERGVSLKVSRVVGRDLAELLQYFEKEQITSIPLDELKTMWRTLDEEVAEEIKSLVAGGADVDARDEDGKTALYVAAENGNTDMVSLLLDRGADVNAATEFGWTALHAAAENGNTDMVSLLLDRGADVNATTKFGKTALHYVSRNDNTDMVSLLLDRGADVNATTKFGKTALHYVSRNGNTNMVSLLLDRGADVNAVNKDNHSPLISSIWTTSRWNFHGYIAVTRLLCSKGSNPNLLALKDKFSLGQHQKVLLACARHWHHCYKQGEPLTEIPIEVINGGKDAVRTYLGDLEKTRSTQIVYRCKACIVGPSTWGKTSLVKSMTKNKPSLVDIVDRTIGIDLFPFTFDENCDNGTTSKVKWHKFVFWNRNHETKMKVKRHNVTFWDFAGQDIYHVTHALFYSERTLYLICVDLSVYATKLEVKNCTKSEKEVTMQRFFEENVLRWVRLILFRQPSAQFKVIGTKDDLVSKVQLKGISVDMNYRMNLFVDNLDKDEITDGVKSALDAEFRQNNLVTTSAARPESIEQARKSIEDAIIAKSNLSFMMPATYSHVLDRIIKIRRVIENATQLDRVKQVVMPFNELYTKLENDVPNLEDAGKCREILRVLHRLGDVLWYEDKITNESELIILDPKIMLELVREVVNHNYEGQVGESYDALRRDGTLHHSLLMTFSWWKSLEEVDGNMVHLFKQLLQHFNLAYPASNVKELDEVDMIVPTYWKTRAAAQKIVKSLAKQPSILSRNNVVGSFIAKWQYSLPVDISDAVYVNFVVRCYRQEVVRKIGATHVECFVRGEFGAVITFVADKTERCDDIMIEVAAATEGIAWAEMREFVMSMESVLLKYPGLKTAKQKMLKRYIVNPKGDRVVVSGLIDDPNEVMRLRYEMPWLPPDFDWFIRRAWENPEKLKQLRAHKIKLHLSHRLDVLKQLVVSGEPRHLPALWTLSYSGEAETSVVELRVHSDLSGVCYHVPLRIAVPKDFVMSHVDLIQDGVSIISVGSSLVPLDVASTAVEMALSASRTALDHAQTVISILAKAGLTRGEVKSATELGIPVQAKMSFLRELLQLHDPTFEDLKVGEVSNLCFAASNEGCYVWVHPRELKDMKGHLTPCHPPKPPMSPFDNSKSISIRVTRLLWAGRRKSQKRIYCEWEVVHQSRLVAIGKTEAAADSGADIAWSSPPVELVDVSSIKMLRESTVKVLVKQPNQYAKSLGDKVIGHGEVHVKDHVGTDWSNSSPIEIKVALEGRTISQQSTAICEVSIGSKETTNQILDQGADVNAVNMDGNTAINIDTELMLVAENGRLDEVRSLVENGANINARSMNGETVLMRAAGKGHIEVVRYLVEQNADVRAVNHIGDSALIHLVKLADDEERALPIAKLLLEYGCSALHSNNVGLSMRSIAIKRGFDAVKNLIEEYAEKQRVPSQISYSLQDDLLILPEDLEKGKLISDGGAFGVVYRGTWKRMDVVIKELRGITSPAEMRTFLREARVWHGARHKNIVSFFGANDREPPFFLVSEFASNGDLITYLKKEKENGRSVVWRKILDVAVGLDVLHSKGIIHGDLKGNNIVVSDDGTAMLTDFGLSFFDEGSQSMPANLNPRWRAPEYVNGTATRPSVESDVFALGMFIVEIVTGEPPWGRFFPEPSIKYHLKRKIPMRQPKSMTDRDWAFVERMICYTRSERISLKDAIAAIEQFANEELANAELE